MAVNDACSFASVTNIPFILGNFAGASFSFTDPCCSFLPELHTIQHSRTSH